ncbi:BRO-N domain-containing protein [Acidithiobacillus ferrooxidans]|uniref:BRO-N domain-containing protein n=1 Tax=Acidithiobacillus ferrooxidans TaxID=920 RepID=UPI000AF01927
MYDLTKTDEPGNQIASFSFKNMQVRIVIKDGEPWFVADDVAKTLGYRESRDMTRVLDEDEAAPHTMRIRSADGTIQTREVTILSESGLYHALLKSRKPEAKPFRKLVTAEVLPAIRKQGFYGQAPAMEAPPGPIALCLLAGTEDRVVHASGLVENDSHIMPGTHHALLLGAEQDLLDIQRNRKAIPRFTGLVTLPSWIRLNRRHAMFGYVVKFCGGTVLSPWLWDDPFTADSIMFMREQYYSMDFGSLIKEQGYSTHCLIRNFR